MTKALGIKFEPHAANAHFESGTVERFHRTLGNYLMHYVNVHKSDWDTYLPYALWAYRTAVQANRKASPYQLMYGRDPVSISALLLNKAEGRLPVVVDTERRVAEALALRDRGTPGGKATSEAGVIQSGDRVYVRKSVRTQLVERWAGPYEVTQVIGVHVHYVVSSGLELVAHISNTKKAPMPDDTGATAESD